MRQFVLVFLPTLSLCLVLACPGRKKSARPREEVRPDAMLKAPARQSPEVVAPQPPTAEDVRAVLARVFNGAVVLDVRPRPGFIVGDFNRDGIEDLAAAVGPVSSRLADINSEAANWTVADPRRTFPRGPKKPFQPLSAPERPRIAAGESLLCVVHGVPPRHWRDVEAQQGYLLKIAAAADMRAYSIKIEGRAGRQDAGKGDGPKKRGDVIRQTLNGVHGYIYWTGAKYAWNHTLPRKKAR